MSLARFIRADVFSGLALLPDNSVDLVLTSPPYLALRSYLDENDELKHAEIGTEGTPAAFLDTLLDVVEACDRVLTPHGTLIFELGDTYSGSGGAGGDYNDGGLRDGQNKFAGSARKARVRSDGGRYWKGYSGGAYGYDNSSEESHGVRPANGGEGWPLSKSVCGIPHAFYLSLAYGRNILGSPCRECGGQGGKLGNAFTHHSGWIRCPVCRGDGVRRTDRWRIRNVVAWCKPNPSVGRLGDKVRPATEYLTIACKSPDRWFDLDAVRHAPLHGLEPDQPVGNGLYKDHPTEGSSASRPNRVSNAAGAPPLDHWWFDEVEDLKRDMLPQDAWLLATRPYSGAHHAVFPPDLIQIPIEAMCPRQVCGTCGEPSRRIVDAQRTLDGEPRDDLGSMSSTGRMGSDADGIGHWRKGTTYTTLGWTDCGHNDWRNGVVLDPFVGSGTTLAVATGHGRDAIGIDLDADNIPLAIERVGMFLTVEETE